MLKARLKRDSRGLVFIDKKTKQMLEDDCQDFLNEAYDWGTSGNGPDDANATSDFVDYIEGVLENKNIIKHDFNLEVGTQLLAVVVDYYIEFYAEGCKELEDSESLPDKDSLRDSLYEDIDQVLRDYDVIGDEGGF